MINTQHKPILQLPNVTLIAVATKNVEAARDAIFYSDRGIDFGRTKLLSQYRPLEFEEDCWAYIPAFESIDEWNHFIFYDLWQHVDTEFAMLIHEDGFVVNPQSWNPEFLNYDYIGAPWSIEVARAIQGGRDQQLARVGNSVSIRSRRLMKLPSEINIPWQRFNGDYNEDTQICAHHRHLFAEHGMTYAPIELAAQFSREHEMPENAHITHPFAFHKHHHPNHPNQAYPKF